MSSAGDPYAVLARGPWTPSRVRARRVERAPVKDARALAIVARAWDEARELARARGQNLFAGGVDGLSAYRVVSPESAGPGEETLELDLHATDYREFVGTNLAPSYRGLPRETAPRADPLGLSVLVVSGDEVILHRRGAACFEWPLAVDTPGGHIEPGRHVDARGAPSPFAAALDELEGELGLRAAELCDLRALALTRIADTEKPQLILAARTSGRPAEVRARLAGARERFETSELIPVRRSELEALARSGERLTPAVRASLALAATLLGPS